VFLPAHTTRRLSSKNMLVTASHHRLMFEITLTLLQGGFFGKSLKEKMYPLSYITL